MPDRGVSISRLPYHFINLLPPYRKPPGADPDFGERGSSHDQIFPTLKNGVPGIGFQTFSRGPYRRTTIGFG